MVNRVKLERFKFERVIARRSLPKQSHSRARTEIASPSARNDIFLGEEEAGAVELLAMIVDAIRFLKTYEQLLGHPTFVYICFGGLGNDCRSVESPNDQPYPKK